MDSISVVVPLYNKRDFIRRAVVSVLSQKFDSLELIVVDDGSTDGSVEQIFDIQDERMIVIHQANRGVGAARNAGIERASNEWVALLDADDYWLDFHLAELVSVIKRCPQALLVSTKPIEMSSECLPSMERLSSEPSFVSYVNYFLYAANNIGFINSSSAAFSKKVLYYTGGFSDKKTGEDLEFWIRIAISFPVAYSNRITSIYFRNDLGVMRSLVSVQRKSGLVSRFSDFSTPLALLKEMDEARPGFLFRSDVIIYANSLMSLAVKSFLLKGEIENAKLVSGMMFKRPLLPFVVYRVVSVLPKFFIKLCLFFYFKVRESAPRKNGQVDKR